MCSSLCCSLGVLDLSEGGRTRGCRRLGFLAVLALVPFLGAVALPGAVGGPLAWVLLVMVGLPLLIAVFPFPGRNLLELGQPVPGVDERDIMFSRATLVPGTERFEEYYRSRPENRDLDDKFRLEPGLLSPGTAHYHREGFAAADAAFWTIEMLRPYVEAGGPWRGGPGRGIQGVHRLSNLVVSSLRARRGGRQRRRIRRPCPGS